MQFSRSNQLAEPTGQVLARVSFEPLRQNFVWLSLSQFPESLKTQQYNI